MVYRRYIKKKVNGEWKTFGPYYYESFRDKDGNTHTRYLPDYKPKRAVTKKDSGQSVFSKHKLLFILLFAIILIFLVIGVLNYNVKDSSQGGADDSGFSFGKLTKGVYSFLTGHATEGGDPVESTSDMSSVDSESSAAESSDGGSAAETSETAATETEVSGDSGEQAVETEISSEEEAAPEDTGQIPQETDVQSGEEGNDSTDSMDSEVTESPEVNETIPEEVNETPETPVENETTEENVTEVNETVVENETEESEGGAGIITNYTNETIGADENFSVVNETNVTIVDEVGNYTTEISLKQYEVVLGEPVKWEKKVKVLSGGKDVDNLNIDLPKSAGNVSAKKVTGSNEKEVRVYVRNEKKVGEKEAIVKGKVEKDKGESIFAKGFSFILGLFRGMTGRTVDNPVSDNVTVEVNEPVGDGEEVVLEYYTEAPYAIEEETDFGKKIKVIGPEDVHYKDILAFTNLSEEATKYALQILDEEEGSVTLNYYDKNNNSLIDYVTWVVPHLSNATYELEINRGEPVRTIVRSRDSVEADKYFAYGKKSKEFIAGNHKIVVRTMEETMKRDIEDDSSVEIVVDKPVSLLLAESEQIIRSVDVRNDFGLSGEGEKICILDTGVDYNNSDITNYAYGFDFVNNDSDPMDDNGHGTNVGGIISRIAPGADLIVAKVISADGVGYESDVLEGLQWCIDEGADVISLSIGSGVYSGYCDSNVVADLVNYIVDNGVFVVAATGNYGNESLVSPSCASSATRVSSTTKDDEIADFSSVNEIVDLFAPGENINVPVLGGGSSKKSGTSLSAPMVAAGAALVLENQSLTPEQLKYRFRSTGKPVLYALDLFNLINISRINVYNAIINNVTIIPYNYSANQSEENGINQTFSTLTACGPYTQDSCAVGESCCATGDCSAGDFISIVDITCADCDSRVEACVDCCASSAGWSLPTDFDYCTSAYGDSFTWESGASGTYAPCCGDDGVLDTWCGTSSFTGCAMAVWYDDADGDTYEYVCETCGSGTYESYWTGTNSACCGDDAGEDFEASSSSSGRACCYNAANLADGSYSSFILCSDGLMYDCGNNATDDGGLGTTSNVGTVLENKYCYDTGWGDKKSNGASCTDADMCSSGYCVDGVCCNSACDGTCYSCNIPAHSCPDPDWPSSDIKGTCTAVANSCDFENECTFSGWDGCSGNCTKTASNSGSCSGSGGCMPTSTSVSANKVCSGGSEVDAGFFPSITSCDGSTDYWASAGGCTYTRRLAECDGYGDCDMDASDNYQIMLASNVPSNKTGVDTNGGESLPYDDASLGSTCDGNVDYWSSLTGACTYQVKYAECDGSGSCDVDASDYFESGGTANIAANKISSIQSGGETVPQIDATYGITCSGNYDYVSDGAGNCTYYRRYAECNGGGSCDSNAETYYQSGGTYNIADNKISTYQIGGTSVPQQDASSGTTCSGTVDYWSTLGECTYEKRYAECHSGSCDNNAVTYFQAGGTSNVPANKTAVARSGGSSTPYADATSQSAACDSNTDYFCSDGDCSGYYLYSECNGGGSCDNSATSYFQKYDVNALAGYSLTSTCGTTGSSQCDDTWMCADAQGDNEYGFLAYGFYVQGACDGSGTCDYAENDPGADASAEACECEEAGTQGTCDAGEGNCWENYAGSMDCCVSGETTCDGANFAACVLGTYRTDAETYQDVCECGGANWTGSVCCGNEVGEDEYPNETSCFDGLDNDCDGVADLNDTDCLSDVPVIVLNAPNDTAVVTSTFEVTFNATVYDDMNLTNVSLWGNWSDTWEINDTNTSGINDTDYLFTLNFAGDGDGTYGWGISAYDNESQVTYSENRTFTMSTVPTITVYYPLSESFSIAEPDNQTFNITFTNATPVDIRWFVNDTEEAGYANLTGFNWTGNYSQDGFYQIKVNITNAQGSDEKIWNMTVNNTPSVVNLDLVYPAGSVNVTQNMFFKVQLNVSCQGEPCGTINVSLDPDNWWNESWEKRKTISITGVDGISETDFPVYINVTYDSDMQADYDDLRFVNVSCGTAGGSEMDYEIENYTAQSAHVWVRMPSISAGTNQICMYYNNSAASSGEDASSVWSEYGGVWHLYDTTTSTTLDSTGNSNDCTKKGANEPIEATGKIYKGQNFDGSDDYSSCTDIDSGIFDGSNDKLTVEAWIYVESTSGNGLIAGKYNSQVAPDERILAFEYLSGGKFRTGYYAAGDTNNYAYADTDDVVISVGTWQYVVSTLDLSTVTITTYFDGEEVPSSKSTAGTPPSAFDDVDEPFFMGSLTGASGRTNFFNGTIDEVRIVNLTRSADWINETYQMIANQASYVLLGSEENYSSSGTKSGLVSTVVGTTPFYTNSSTNPVTTIELNSSDSQLITFWVNATGDINSTHEFFAYANLTSNESIGNSTSVWNVTIKANGPPNDPSPILVSVDGSKSSSADLNCSATLVDVEEDDIDVSVRWYKNGALNFTQDFNNSYSSGYVFSTLLGSGNLSASDVWICEMRLTDGNSFSNWANSSELQINSPWISINATYPGRDVNVTQNEFFRVDLNVTCHGEDCGTINVSLDPEESLPYLYTQRGEESFGTADSSMDVPISEVNTSSAFIIVYGRAAATDLERVEFTASFVNSTAIRIQRGETGIAAVAAWQVIEADSDADTPAFEVQTDETSIGSGDTTVNVPINEVSNLTNSVVFYSARHGNGDIRTRMLYTANLTNSTNLRLSRTTSGTTSEVRWWVVTFNEDFYVQKGYVTISSATSTSDSISEVNLTRSAAFITWDADTDGLAQSSPRAYLSSSTQIDFDKTDTTGTNHIQYNVVEFPEGVVVQSDNGASSPTLDTLAVVSLSSVVLNGTWNVHSSKCTGTGQAYPRPYVTSYLPNSTALELKEDYSGQTKTVTYYVIDTSGWTYNPTAIKSGLVSTVGGTIPFYTNKSSNPFTTSSLSEGQSETVTFWVNATGALNSTHEFFAYSNLTSNESISNTTSTWNVTIVENATIAIAIQLSPSLGGQINWSLASVPVYNQSADGNNGTGVSEYWVNLSVEGGTADLYMRANDNLSTSGGDKILLGNETYSYNSTNSSVPSGVKTQITTNFVDNKVGDSLTDGSTVYLKFFLSAPPAQAAGYYNNTLYFKAVEHGASP